ncbi:MAG: RluA family pseudouridine synthase [Clostridiales bacterium]|jgi:23S rRNA pseudouridine955/2504/2580 synthase|nr:RluA family pseudouridine synthase [Clostridiales bacterium]
MRRFLLDKKNFNQRLDKYLLKIISSKSFVYKLLRKKIIKLNNMRASGSEILSPDDIIDIYINDDVFEKFKIKKEKIKSNKKISIIYEDENILVCDKENGVLSQPNKINCDSILNRLYNYLNDYNISICNRLDFDTTGIIICAKNFLAKQELNKMIFNNEVKKYYFALVYGEFSDSNYILNDNCVKDKKRNILKISNNDDDKRNKNILTKFRVISSRDNFSFIKINLVTGKSHQIRAQMSHINHPIIGDKKYGNNKINLYFKKFFCLNHQLLHAYEINFDFDINKYYLLKYLNNLKINCNLPDMFKMILDKYELNDNKKINC